MDGVKNTSFQETEGKDSTERNFHPHRISREMNKGCVVFLFKKRQEKETKSERKTSQFNDLPPQMPTRAKERLGPSQTPGTKSNSLNWVAETQVFVPSLPPFQAAH